MAWTCLFAAGLLEVAWAYFMKQSEGFSRPLPSAAAVGLMVCSFALLAFSMRALPLGVAYAVWTGVGAVGALLLGVLVLGESLSPMRLTAAGLIVGGLVLMRLSTAD